MRQQQLSKPGLTVQVRINLQLSLWLLLLWAVSKINDACRAIVTQGGSTCAVRAQAPAHGAGVWWWW